MGGFWESAVPLKVYAKLCVLYSVHFPGEKFLKSKTTKIRTTDLLKPPEIAL